MLITDGFHLSPDFIKVALRTKGVERFIVTSDAAPAAGLIPGKYTFGGQGIILEETGLIRSSKGDYLAGSSALLLDCINHLSSFGILSEEELWQVGFFNPLKLLGKQLPESDYYMLPEVIYDGKKFR